MKGTFLGSTPENLYQSFLDRLDRPGWKKFASAMVALGMAFLLAVYSSVFAQEGRLLGTAICASLALFLAGYVAITAVPYLARRTRLEWLRVSIDYRLTREGMFFIIFIFILAIAGLNTGNNLLYLILASLLAAILMSGVLSLAVLTGMELEVLLPTHVFARRPVPARIRLTNQKKLLPSFSILLSGGKEEEKGKKKQKHSKKTETEPSPFPSDRQILQRPLYFPFLPAKRSIIRSLELQFPLRGLYREESFSMSTRFPFGFLEKTLHLPVSQTLWVYPAVEPTEEFYEILPMLAGELEALQKGRGHDLYSIRDMVSTDSARHVDWKASARTGEWKVREFTREDERRLQIILDPRVGPLDSKSLEQFERAVEFCACLAWHFHEIDAQLQFVCGDFHTPMARANELIYEILQFLAAVEPSGEVPHDLPALAADENIFRIICTAAPHGSVPTMLWSRSYLIFFDMLQAAAKKSRLSPAENAPQASEAPPVRLDR
ncbi:MAG: DUF58 domain-containing protein [Acidobacteria bacterium]|nr:DUF58 domain-containing protein [Acidobacteriota bacterium]